MLSAMTVDVAVPIIVTCPTTQQTENTIRISSALTISDERGVLVERIIIIEDELAPALSEF